MLILAQMLPGIAIGFTQKLAELLAAVLKSLRLPPGLACSIIGSLR